MVDVLLPSDEPVNATDLIAEKPSKAADELDDTPGGPDRGAPRVEKVDRFDRVEIRAPASPAPRPVHEPVQPPDLRRENVAATPPHKEESASLVQDEQGDEHEPAAQSVQSQQTPPRAPPLALQEARGRVEGGVKRTGLMSFEAMESEIAPYLKVIRQRVERNWRTALHTRYSGTSRTRAVLDCAIAPDGHIIEVAIVEPGDSATFAPLCKQAIENAGPFDAFPFEVPEVYRSKNLEIRWTFSFLD